MNVLVYHLVCINYQQVQGTSTGSVRTGTVRTSTVRTGMSARHSDNVCSADIMTMSGPILCLQDADILTMSARHSPALSACLQIGAAGRNVWNRHYVLRTSTSHNPHLDIISYVTVDVPHLAYRSINHFKIVKIMLL